MKISEAQIQEQVVQYLRAQYPLVVFTATLGGLKLSVGMAMKIRRQGYETGTPDLLILEPNANYHGLAIELKSDTGKPSIEQIKKVDRLNAKGYKAVFHYSAKDAIIEIDNYMSDACIAPRHSDTEAHTATLQRKLGDYPEYRMIDAPERNKPVRKKYFTT